MHAALLTGARNRVETFLEWGFDYFSRSRGPQILDRRTVAAIDWSDDTAQATEATTPAPTVR